jgi:putative ABC transport system ATP-binding protein
MTNQEAGAPATVHPLTGVGGTAVGLENVEKVYQTDKIETVALSDINLSVRQGEFISIMGPSGSGKSTLLNILGLLDAPTLGVVSLGDGPVRSYSDKRLSRIRNEEFGFIFQTFHLISDLNVLDNVEIPLLYRRGFTGNRRQAAKDALERVGLTQRMGHFPSQLSGGQQQRVAIARAIVGRPKILLADEPTGNLDSQMGGEIMELLEGFNRDDKMTIVMVTHDPRLAERTERTIRLFDGRQVQ